MTKELEDRLNQLEKKLQARSEPSPAWRRNSRKRLWVLAGLLAVIAVSGAAVIWQNNSQPSKLPDSIIQQASFNVYYPTKLPMGYNLNEKSIRLQSDIVLYQVTDGSRTITVNQQALPAQPPSLNIPGFKKIDILAGSAVIGNNAGLPTLVILTNTTLITVNGSRNIPNNILKELADQLNAI